MTGKKKGKQKIVQQVVLPGFLSMFHDKMILVRQEKEKDDGESLFCNRKLYAVLIAVHLSITILYKIIPV